MVFFAHETKKLTHGTGISSYKNEGWYHQQKRMNIGTTSDTEFQFDRFCTIFLISCF